MRIDRLAAWTSLGVVLAAVIAGFYLAGSPARQRLLRIDAQRINDLQQISRTIGVYWTRNKRLPTELNELVDGVRMTALPSDPSAGQPYEYEAGPAAGYALCAVFNLPSPEDMRADFWNHDSGRRCFFFDLQAESPE